MGANATTFVPAYVANEVLTAADLNVTNSGIPVFTNSTTRDAAFGGSGEKVLAEGQYAYLESDKKTYVYNGTSWVGVSTMTKVATFTSSGTWTVPAGVTYAVAHIRAGGGGVGMNSSPGTGGTSSVAFAAGTVSSTGGLPYSGTYAGSVSGWRIAGTNNSGQGALFSTASYVGASTDIGYGVSKGQDGAELVYGGDVTPGASITITVGAGGVAGATQGAAGGSGFVWIEYQG